VKTPIGRIIPFPTFREIFWGGGLRRKAAPMESFSLLCLGMLAGDAVVPFFFESMFLSALLYRMYRTQPQPQPLLEESNAKFILSLFHSREKENGNHLEQTE